MKVIYTQQTPPPKEKEKRKKEGNHIFPEHSKLPTLKKLNINFFLMKIMFNVQIIEHYNC